jgi:hypothetical protein
MVEGNERLALRQVGSGVAAGLLLLTLGSPVNAARSAATTASVHIALRYDEATSTWRGTFRALRLDGVVVARGRVVDRPRQKLGADWFIIRRLTTRVGTVRFRISGPFRRPTVRLHWLVVGGTGSYAALQGQGVDVERVRTETATAVMRGVHFP